MPAKGWRKGKSLEGKGPDKKEQDKGPAVDDTIIAKVMATKFKSQDAAKAQAKELREGGRFARTGERKDGWHVYVDGFHDPAAAASRERIRGGQADGIPDKKFDKAQVQEGIKIELEHTDDPKVATEIVKDHIAETGGKDQDGKIRSDYYPELKAMEKQLKHKKLRDQDIPKIVKTFMPDLQKKAIIGNPELWEVMSRLEKTTNEMPKSYETENIPSSNKKAYLHYFNSSSDWYIIEKDQENEQHQAFGWVILNGDFQNAEFGYISIEELKKNAVELDFFFEPTNIEKIKKQHGPKDLPAYPPLEVQHELVNAIAEGKTEEAGEIRKEIQDAREIVKTKPGIVSVDKAGMFQVQSYEGLSDGELLTIATSDFSYPEQQKAAKLEVAKRKGIPVTPSGAGLTTTTAEEEIRAVKAQEQHIRKPEDWRKWETAEWRIASILSDVQEDPVQGKIFLQEASDLTKYIPEKQDRDQVELLLNNLKQHYAESGKKGTNDEINQVKRILFALDEKKDPRRQKDKEFEITVSGNVEAGEYGTGMEMPIVVQAKNEKEAISSLDLPAGVKVQTIEQQPKIPKEKTQAEINALRKREADIEFIMASTGQKREDLEKDSDSGLSFDAQGIRNQNAERAKMPRKYKGPTMDEIGTYIDKQSKEQSQIAFKKYVQDSMTRLYLYYLPSTAERWGVFKVAHDSPGPDWEIATPEHIPRDRTMAQLKQWVHDQTGRLKIIPWDVPPVEATTLKAEKGQKTPLPAVTVATEISPVVAVQEQYLAPIGPEENPWMFQKARYNMGGRAIKGDKPKVGDEAINPNGIKVKVVEVQDHYDLDDALDGWRVRGIPIDESQEEKSLREARDQLESLKKHQEVINLPPLDERDRPEIEKDREETRSEIAKVENKIESITPPTVQVSTPPTPWRETASPHGGKQAWLGHVIGTSEKYGLQIEFLGGMNRKKGKMDFVLKNEGVFKSANEVFLVYHDPKKNSMEAMKLNEKDSKGIASRIDDVGEDQAIDEFKKKWKVGKYE
jgi:hypothetical protein